MLPVDNAMYAPPPTLKRVSRTRPPNAENLYPLESVSLRLPCPCNLACSYCYSRENRVPRSGALKFVEILAFLEDAWDLGVTSVSLVGAGEPLLYADGDHDIFHLMDVISRNGKTTILFTNLTEVDARVVRFVLERDIVVIGKQNTLDTGHQDRMTGAHVGKRMEGGLALLLEAGLAQQKRLAIHTVILNENYDEIPQLWRHCRSLDIIPYVQVWVPPLGTTMNEYIRTAPDPGRIRELFANLLTIDRTEFGYDWDPGETYPIAGLGCTVVRTGVALDVDGGVKFCAYTGDAVANIRSSRLPDILKLELVRRIRSHDYCEVRGRYGCRALTMALTGSRFDPDPVLARFKEVDHA